MSDYSKEISKRILDEIERRKRLAVAAERVRRPVPKTWKVLYLQVIPRFAAKTKNWPGSVKKRGQLD